LVSQSTGIAARKGKGKGVKKEKEKGKREKKGSTQGQPITWFLWIDQTAGHWYPSFMPRKLRVEYPGAMCHVMSRGDRRENIFLDDADLPF